MIIDNKVYLYKGDIYKKTGRVATSKANKNHILYEVKSVEDGFVDWVQETSLMEIHDYSNTDEKYHDLEYLKLVEDVLSNGEERNDRTGTGTLSVFGRQMRFDLSNNSIPLLTTKKMHIKSVIHEILWYIKGDTNVKYLQKNGVKIWNEWADENGDLGPVYGHQWRKWDGYEIILAQADGNEYLENNVRKQKLKNATLIHKKIDQLAIAIDKIKNNPHDRRIIVNSWNVGELDNMALPPCHMMFQFYVGNDGLSCHLYQRSADVGLGVPFNIVQYSILTHMVAKVCDLEAKEFIWTGGDVHIYKNHIDALKKQLTRQPYPSPTLNIPKYNSIEMYSYGDFVIESYKCHDTIKMEVSV